MRHFSLRLVAACLTASSALAEPIAYKPPETVDGASIIIIDGDTIGLPSRERIRILEIDTPETFDSRCENELILGLKAKQRLAELLRAGPVTIERHDRDRFHRTLAYLRLADGRGGRYSQSRRHRASVPARQSGQRRAARPLVWEFAARLSCCAASNPELCFRCSAPSASWWPGCCLGRPALSWRLARVCFAMHPAIDAPALGTDKHPTHLCMALAEDADVNLAEAPARIPEGTDPEALEIVWTDSPLEAALHVYESPERKVIVEVLAFDLPALMTEAEFRAQDWPAAIRNAQGA
jgi:hypothetical protein